MSTPVAEEQKALAQDTEFLARRIELEWYSTPSPRKLPKLKVVPSGAA